jgi:cytochrome c
VTRLAAGLAGAAALLFAGLCGARADEGRGEVVFQRCYACHSVKAEEKNLQGPSLRDVLGRRAGTVPGFEYSAAMIDAGANHRLVWTRKTLDAFLADPQRLVPGTSMSMPPLRGPADRRDVIDYLAQNAKAPRGASGNPPTRKISR